MSGGDTPTLSDVPSSRGHVCHCALNHWHGQAAVAQERPRACSTFDSGTNQQPPDSRGAAAAVSGVIMAHMQYRQN